ncbi:MAG TPA: hypothetical protein VF006_10070 [Longimicrobium sp.]
MSYRVRRDPRGVPGLTLHDEPAYCHALAANVPALEAELARGVWLVMAFAAWSGPDVDAVGDAIGLARRYGGRLSLGLRPYDDAAELNAWWPDADPDASGPFWVLLRDGEVRRHTAHRLAADQLDEWVRAEALQAIPPHPPETRHDGA